MTPDHTHELESLLDYLKRSRGFDFTGYKRASLTRRIEKRMQAVDARSYAHFIEVLDKNTGELDQLFNTVLINVTAFFRDGVPWDTLAADIIPRLLEAKGSGEPIRVWSAGCATGEEAYTLAIVLAEVLGHDAFRARVKIYATDVDEHALAIARHATYDEKAVEGVPPALREKYFERQDNRYVVRKDLRRFVIFGRNDLVQDASISRIDLLVCRNTLMYFNAATQAKVLARFHFALADNGYLLLGRAETMLAHNTTFTPIDLKRRIFMKAPKANYRTRLLAMAHTSDGPQPGATEPAVDESTQRLRDAAWDISPLAQIVVDADGQLVLANDRARAMFNLGLPDLGRPFHDLELSYRPTELRSVINEAYADHRPVTVRAIQWAMRGGEMRWIDVQVTPLYDGDRALGACISFDDVSESHRLHRELERSTADLETAYEELQSTNEELTTVNDELRRRSDELNDVNDFMESVLASLRGGVAVLDPELRVEVWNDKAFDLWGVHGDEVRGVHFMMLDIGLPVRVLAKSVRACLSGESANEELTVDAINRRGKPITCKVTCTPMRARSADRVRGVIVVMDEVPGQQS